jgi:uncharacterized membrane protein YesL
MNNFFNPDNFFWRWFGKLADIVVLSIFWILCCLPLVTIIPACIALYDTIVHCIHGPEEHPYKHFFLSLKSELLRGIGINLLWGILAFVLTTLYNYLSYLGETNQFAAMYSTVYLATMLIPVGILAWLIPLESRFTHSFASLHKTAATFTILHLPTTAILLGLLAAAILLLMFFPVLAILIPGLVVTVQAWFIEKVFKNYLPKEDTANDTAV